ncbi:MAG: Spy/CpxP family protein refolding chaperone [Ramlibacter sp.]
MNRFLRTSLATCALVAGAGLAAAQTQPGAPVAPAAPGGPEAHGRHVDPAKMAERMNRHLADLKQKLQLSPAQEGAWTSFANAMQPQAPMQRPDPQAMAGLSTPERIDQMRAMRDRRNAEMDRRAEATKAFYAQLTPEQKKTFDAETARMGHGPQGHGDMHGGQGGAR